MIPGEFIINGISSLEFGAFIQSRPLINTPKRKRQYVDAYGRSGSIILDEEESYENTEMELLGYSVGDKEIPNSASLNREKLFNIFNQSNYINLRFYFDDNKIYRVSMEDPVSFEARYYYGEGQAWMMTLSIKPFKYYVNNNQIVLNSPGVLTNPYYLDSKPIIKVVGSGDITLSINGIDYELKNITDYIILDSNTWNGYKELAGGKLQSENNKVYFRDFPKLEVGVNDISWSGNVSQLEIDPKWRSLV